jgi:hypothetical protein
MKRHPLAVLIAAIAAPFLLHPSALYAQAPAPITHPAPTKQPIEIRARDFVRGTNVAVDQCVVGPDTLANAPPCRERPNAAEFDFVPRAAGTYRLDINFAAKDSRPVKVILNGEVIRDQALTEKTGGWLNSNLRWSVVGKVVLKEGTNTVRLERAKVFPHIHDLRFDPVTE